MGSQSVKAIKSKKERKKIMLHLLNDIDAFKFMIDNNLFETGIARVGAEQELCIVDKDYRPSAKALEILKEVDDPHYTTELALFNLEINLDPHELKNNCFSNIERELHLLLEKGYRAAEKVSENKLVLAGILPTLRTKDLAFKNITPFKRYKTLNSVLKKIKGNDFKLHIQGVDELILKHKSILFEACNTSFQVHLQINPNEAVDKYNWSQAIAGPLLAIMSNSPLLLGKELWSETRIALFQQSVDLRNITHFSRGQKPRVSFGNAWVKKSILELFTDDISRYPPIVSTELKEDAMASLQKGIMPKLKALNLHNGTLYKWNRLCYGVHENTAHLRIENRYIPAGPSVKDEIANALLWVGVMQAMPEEYKDIWLKMDFKDARGNFITAARTGINSYFNWFGKGISAIKMLENILIPMAREGLLKSNIAVKEIDYYLNIISSRIKNTTTGSKWLIRNKRALRKVVSNYESNVILTEQTYKNQRLNLPISDWKNIDVYKNDIAKKYNKVYKIMSTELFVVHENDLLLLVTKIMHWKNIHHIPVVNKENNVVGVIDKNQLTNLHLTEKDLKCKVAKSVMTKKFDFVHPETSYKTVKEMIKNTTNTCVLVLLDERLIGIFTENDLVRIEKLRKSK